MSDRPEYSIAIPDTVDLRLLVAKVYELSRPQGLGFLHAKDGPLDEETIDEILNPEHTRSWSRFTTDYVHGRACKFTLYQDEDGLFCNCHWFDHGDSQLIDLMEAIGVSEETVRAAQAKYSSQ